VYTKDDELLDIAANFYDSLYKSKNVNDNDINNYLDNTQIEQRLSDDERDSIEGKISYHECNTVITHLKVNKSPGLDGIPSEFYMKFWNKIGNIVVDSFNEGYDDGKLLESQRRSVISLIFKKGDAQLLSNYRPMSLMNVDYKILAFCLANRMQTVIKTIINSSQVAYIKGRYIGCNIRLIDDVIDYCETNEKGAVLMMLDFQKAFDSLEWNFLFTALKCFNFGESFIHWIKTLYKSPSACIKNNGYLSRDVQMERSIRQGCPISALLFIVAVETMAINIRQNENIGGISIDNGDTVKIMQYADDGVLFLNNEEEIHEAIRLITRFGNVAGTSLNVEKSEGLWLRPYKYRQQNCTLLDIKWPKGPIRCLGVYIGLNSAENLICNWTNKIENVKTLLNTWRMRELTLFGKVTIIKQLALPKVLYTVTVLPIPTGIVEELDRICYNFLWGNTEKVKRNVLINKIDKGGIQFLDVQSLFESVKAAWVVRLLNAKEDDKWSIIAKYVLKYTENDNLIFKLNVTSIRSIDIFKNMPMFYKEVLVAYNKSKCINKDTFCKTILDQPIWANEYVKAKDTGRNVKVLFYRNWINCNVLKIRNLKFVDGILDDQYLMRIIRNKTNIFSEISRLRQALKPYKIYLGDHDPDNDTCLPVFWRDSKPENVLPSAKSKMFYENIVSLKVERPIMERHWIEVFNDEEVNFKNMYTKKILCIKDKKLAEFNFKVINNILPCNVNLKHWRKSDTEMCNICNTEETIEHLLYQCHYAQSIWRDFLRITGVNITLADIVIGNKLNLPDNFVVTLVSYLIYKNWLRESLRNVQREQLVTINVLIPDLKYRARIYNALKWNDIVSTIDLLCNT
jgi:hypothetical protein